MQVPQHLANAIVDPKAYAEGTPLDEAFLWLRKNAPFPKVQPDGYDPIWVATRYDDLKAIEVEPELFCSGANLPTFATREALKVRADSGFTSARTLVSMDPPDHAAYRRMTQDWFMPKNLKAFEPRIRARAAAAVDRMAGMGGSCDFAIDIAMNYPLQIIMEILGLPDSDEAMMLELTQGFFGSRDPDFGGAEVDSPAKAQENLQRIVNILREYFERLTHERRKNPANDLASAIANGTIRGEPIDIDSAIGYYVIAATAGHDTTSNSLSYAMWALAENPAIFRRVKSDKAVIPAFIAETLRWGTPVKHFVRTATRDTEFAGQRIERGDQVMLSYASANRDEAVFDRPFEFDMDRKPNRHLAYGYGPHLCLGQNLANLELRVFLEELLARLGRVELAGEPRRTEANFVCGPKALPVAFEME